jgi:hypothetical protein
MTLLAAGDNSLGAGFIGFMVVVVMGIACYFLFRSFTRQMRKVPASFDEPASAPPPAASERDEM